MTEFLSLPLLELGETSSPFDEAVILIDGREEETIRIECEGAADLADKLIRLVNGHAQIVKVLSAAALALRSYEYGNAAPDLAHDIADYCDRVASQVGAAA
jgi:hypothetical protein